MACLFSKLNSDSTVLFGPFSFRGEHVSVQRRNHIVYSLGRVVTPMSRLESEPMLKKVTKSCHNAQCTKTMSLQAQGPCEKLFTPSGGDVEHPPPRNAPILVGASHQSEGLRPVRCLQEKTNVFVASVFLKEGKRTVESRFRTLLTVLESPMAATISISPALSRCTEFGTSADGLPSGQSKPS